MTFPRIITDIDTDREIITGFKNDCIHVSNHHVQLQNKSILDLRSITHPGGNKRHHIDFIQLIFKHIKWGQYALMSLDDILIADNFLYSVAHRNGIFSSDGLFTNLQLINNTIVTGSPHAINIGGVLSAVIIGNNVQATLMPARVGGRPEGLNNVWINSFIDRNYRDILNSDRLINDRRRDHISDDDIHLNNFNLSDFHAEVRTIPYPDDVNDYCATLQQVALNHGSI